MNNLQRIIRINLEAKTLLIPVFVILEVLQDKS